MVTRATDDFINKKTRGLKNRLMNLVGRCVLSAVDDSKKLQEVKVTIFEGETKDELEHFQSYGFTSNAPSGSEALALSLNGNRDHTVIVCIDNREFRLKSLANGEVAVYSKFNNSIILKSDGSIEMNCSSLNVNSSGAVTMNAGGDVNVNSSHTKMSGQQTVKQDITVTDQATSIGQIKNTYNSHTHVGDSGGTTQPPNQPI